MMGIQYIIFPTVKLSVVISFMLVLFVVLLQRANFSIIEKELQTNSPTCILMTVKSGTGGSYSDTQGSEASWTQGKILALAGAGL